MRALLLLCLLIPLGSMAQDRLHIEVVPVPTLGAKMVQGEAIAVTADYDAAFEKLYAGIDEALAVLGLQQDEYEVRVWTDEALLGELTIACDIFARWKSAIVLLLRAGRYQMLSVAKATTARSPPKASPSRQQRKKWLRRLRPIQPAIGQSLLVCDIGTG